MSAPLRVRLSTPLQAALGRVGDNASAAARALLVLGLHAAGYDLAALRRDIALLLAEQLDAPVAQALREISEGRRTGVGQASYTPEAAPARLEELDDPLGAIGIEV